MTDAEKMEIVVRATEATTKRVLAQALTLAAQLEEAAKALRDAAESGDLVRAAWLSRVYDKALAERLEGAHEINHLLAGLREAK